MNVSDEWMSDALELLCHAPCGYRHGSTPAAEPTALAAIALLGAKRYDDAQPHLQWLAAHQNIEITLQELKMIRLMVLFLDSQVH